MGNAGTGKEGILPQKKFNAPGQRTVFKTIHWQYTVTEGDVEGGAAVPEMEPKLRRISKSLLLLLFG